MVAEGTFRRDLYFRINVVTIQVPPLRSRLEDIEPLARAFLTRYSAGSVTLESDALTVLKSHAWPGNVRELENAIERAVVLRQNPDRITPGDLPWEITAPATESGVIPAGGAPISPGLPEGGIDFSSVEKSLLEQALRKAGGNRSRAARLLGMTRQTLLYRLKKFGIENSR
jgi:two-component system response regulator AtoC